MAKELNRHTIKEDIQMANTYITRCSHPVLSPNCKIETRYYYVTIRIAFKKPHILKIQIAFEDMDWEQYEFSFLAIVIRIIQLLWKRVGQFLTSQTYVHHMIQPSCWFENMSIQNLCMNVAVLFIITTQTGSNHNYYTMDKKIMNTFTQ